RRDPGVADVRAAAGPVELLPRAGEPAAAAAVRRRAHRSGALREGARPDPPDTGPGGPAAGGLHPSAAGHLDGGGAARWDHAVDGHRGHRQPDQTVLTGATEQTNDRT